METRASKRQKRALEAVSASSLAGRRCAAASSSSASAPAPIATSASRPLALVLGMAHVSKSYVDQLTVRHGTTYGALRDYLRLNTMAKRSSLDIITMNDKQSAEDCHGNRHYQAPFGGRAASGLQRQFGVTRLSHVYLDYFRFPPGYIQVAYRDFADMLARLVESGLVHDESDVVVPNFAELRERLFARFERNEARPLRRHARTDGDEEETVYLHYAPLKPNDYPLYAATENLWRKSRGAVKDRSKKPRVLQSDMESSALGGFAHRAEITQLRANAPFVRITVTRDAAAARRSFRDTFPESTNTYPATTAASSAAAAAARATSPTTTTLTTTLKKKMHRVAAKQRIHAVVAVKEFKHRLHATIELKPRGGTAGTMSKKRKAA